TILLWGPSGPEDAGTLLSPFSCLMGAVAFAGDGKALVTSAQSTSEGPFILLEAWGLRPSAWRGALQAPPPSIYSLDFAPDGKALAVVEQHTLTELPATCTLYGMADGRPRLRLTGHTAPIVGLSYSPDGKLLLTAG